jgi:hypothetical protein
MRIVHVEVHIYICTPSIYYLLWYVTEDLALLLFLKSLCFPISRPSALAGEHNPDSTTVVVEGEDEEDNLLEIKPLRCKPYYETEIRFGGLP